MKYIKDKTFFSDPLIHNGMTIYNPPEAYLLAAGYKRYIESEVDKTKADLYECESFLEETDEEIRRVYRYSFSPEKAQKHYSRLAQNMMDQKAKERNYDGIMSVCSYLLSSNSRFAAEAEACTHWRDAVWSRCYELLTSVLTGEMALPTEQEFLQMLPAFEWPEG